MFVVLFPGVSFAAHVYQITPSDTETVISQLAHANLRFRPLYGLTIIATLAILLVAANTPPVGLPMLLALVAGDGFAPRSLKEQGDRCVQPAASPCWLVLRVSNHQFQGSVTALTILPLPICSTLSQLGIAARFGDKEQRDWLSLGISLLGAFVTGLVALVIAVSKFTDGAWVVVVLIPVLVLPGAAGAQALRLAPVRMTIRPDEKKRAAWAGAADGGGARLYDQLAAR